MLAGAEIHNNYRSENIAKDCIWFSNRQMKKAKVIAVIITFTFHDSQTNNQRNPNKNGFIDSKHFQPFDVFMFL